MFSYFGGKKSIIKKFDKGLWYHLVHLFNGGVIHCNLVENIKPTR